MSKFKEFDLDIKNVKVADEVVTNSSTYPVRTCYCGDTTKNCGTYHCTCH